LKYYARIFLFVIPLDIGFRKNANLYSSNSQFNPVFY
jgi:hypothetical protein